MSETAAPAAGWVEPGESRFGEIEIAAAPPAGPDATAIEALRHLFFVMERLDKQAGPPYSDDHMVRVTVETWERFVRPAIRTVQARLTREGADPK